MPAILTAFFVTFAFALFIIKSNKYHEHLSGDHNLDGPQKFHSSPTPRIGGLAIALGVGLSILFQPSTNTSFNISILLPLCALPVLAIGLLEDITKKISVRMRLFFIAIAASLAIVLLGAQITSLDIIGIDWLLSMSMISILFTVFAITGLSNAFNIIDGFNGLSSMVGIITLLAITYLALTLGDRMIAIQGAVMIAAILGFFILNYPRGLIFLGDSGAYLIGFWVAVLSILIVNRHPEVSPWFALLINAYPIVETLFTIYRRKIHQGKSPGQPDGIHLHTLLYRRLLKNYHPDKQWFTANARAAPYLWVLAVLGITPAVLWWYSTPVLMSASLIFLSSYIWVYKNIVRFKTPRWLA